MPNISLIAAMDEHRGLGKENKLLCHLPADLKHFKTLTMGKPIIMGRKTYESIGKALPGRLNIVLSKHELNLSDATVVDSLPEALALVIDRPEVMIIGGASLYKEALAVATQLYLTVIHATFDADVFFPEFNQQSWICREAVEKASDDNNQYALTFYRYERDTF